MRKVIKNPLHTFLFSLEPYKRRVQEEAYKVNGKSNFEFFKQSLGINKQICNTERSTRKNKRFFSLLNSHNEEDKITQYSNKVNENPYKYSGKVHPFLYLLDDYRYDVNRCHSRYPCETQSNKIFSSSLKYYILPARKNKTKTLLIDFKILFKFWNINKITLRLGAEGFLQKAKKNFELILISKLNPEFIKEMITKNHLSEYFDLTLLENEYFKYTDLKRLGRNLDSLVVLVKENNYFTEYTSNVAVIGKENEVYYHDLNILLNLLVKAEDTRMIIPNFTSLEGEFSMTKYRQTELKKKLGDVYNIYFNKEIS